VLLFFASALLFFALSFVLSGETLGHFASAPLFFELAA
jgi:hypothetical protein